MSRMSVEIRSNFSARLVSKMTYNALMGPLNPTHSLMDKVAPRIFHWDTREGPKVDSRVGVLGEEAATPSAPAVWGALRAPSPAGFGAKPRPPNGFPQFSALRVASPDTILLLIVEYRAAIGGQGPLAYAPLTDRVTPEPSGLGITVQM